MGVYELLSTKEDARKGSPLCVFNGFLEDYLSGLEETHEDYAYLKGVLDYDNDTRVMVDLRMGISQSSVANQIIRYKDIYKLDNKAVIIPYIFYWKKDEREIAALIARESYIYAKAMYYTLTEPNSELKEYRNDILALEVGDLEGLTTNCAKLATNRAGYLQRGLDRKYFDNYETAYQQALKLSDDVMTMLKETKNVKENREDIVQKAVSSWFLIKKFVYVQLMVDKRTLEKEFEGNIHKQRYKAKENADSIHFISYADLWRGRIEPEVDKKEEQVEATAEVEAEEVNEANAEAAEEVSEERE